MLINPVLHQDDRGFFYESWNDQNFRSDLIKSGVPESEVLSLNFSQDNHSRSYSGVVRGLHFQVAPYAQGKLVRCSFGEIFDVVVDIRCSSPTYSQWVGVYLSSDNHHQLWVPPGFAHGFLTISEYADVQYKCSGYWHSSSERSLRWDDPALAISWPTGTSSVPIHLSTKDAAAPAFQN